MKKKDVRKIKSATKEELEKLKGDYDAWAKNSYYINNSTLVVLCVLSVAALFYFRNAVFDFIGFIVFVYTFYTLASRVGHREGYLDGYYEASHQIKGGDPDMSAGPRKEMDSVASGK